MGMAIMDTRSILEMTEQAAMGGMDTRHFTLTPFLGLIPFF